VRAVIGATAEDAVVSSAFNAGLAVPGPHRVLRSSIAAAEALEDEHAGVVRMAGAELPALRFGPLPPTRQSSGTIEAMPFYAGQSAGAVRAIQPAADIMAERRTGMSRPAWCAASPLARPVGRRCKEHDDAGGIVIVPRYASHRRHVVHLSPRRVDRSSCPSERR
jgi:hypothetical protein